MSMHEYKVRIQYNDDDTEPLSVYVVRHGEILGECHGSNLLELLNESCKSIISEEEKEKP